MKDFLYALAFILTGSVLWIAVPIAGAIVAPALAVLVVYALLKELRHETGTKTDTTPD